MPLPTWTESMLIEIVYEDPSDQETYTSTLENENQSLRSRVEALERELLCRSPTKSPKKTKVPSLDFNVVRNAAGNGSMPEFQETTIPDLDVLSLSNPKNTQSPAKKPGKKMRTLTARKWDLMDENEIDALENH